jgi:hypothetical protein
MKRQTARALAALLVAGAALVVLAPAAAGTSGNETFKGVIVTTGTSGVRTVVTSPVVAKGVFNGIGKIVEVDNLPGDPDDVSRDDFVFRGGVMHLVTTTLDFSISVDPHTCFAKAKLVQTSAVVGGTGRFASASGTFDATVNGRAILARNPDGSCSFDQAALYEVDEVEGTGTLAF